MNIRFKRVQLPSGELYAGPMPLVATAGAAAADFYAGYRVFQRFQYGALLNLSASDVKAGDLVRYHTGLALEIPEGYVGLAAPRSSVVKKPLSLANSIGIIDSDFRGELSFIFRILDANRIEEESYKVGERCGQLMILRKIYLTFEESCELSETSRGEGGYGSTGK